MRLRRKDVLEIAKGEVDRRGWTWIEPVRVTEGRRWLVLGSVRWRVWTNSEGLGCNAVIEIDDATGRVLSAKWLPR